MDQDPATLSFPTVVAPFAHALIELAREHQEVVVLTADLAKWTDVRPFAERYPQRFFQVGMAEQNLIGIAAGMGKTGLYPIAVSFGVFATRRAYDQIAMGLATGPTPSLVVGFLPGVTSRFRATHQASDDIALMRALPGMTVLDPADACELKLSLKAAVQHPGPIYLRANRGPVPLVFGNQHSFQIGVAHRAREGADGLVVSTGLGTVWALEAAAALASTGPQLQVLHMPTIKPLDTSALLAAAALHGRLVVVENHSVIGGLGEAVCSALSTAGAAVEVRLIGIGDRWGAYGTPDHNRSALGLDRESLLAAFGELAGAHVR